MGAASKVIHVLLRVWELVCSVIVLGLLAHFLHLVSEAGATNDGRIIYALIVASISTLFSLVFMPPFLYAYLAFPADFALFVMWLVAFSLLIARTGVWTCSVSWYWNYWGFYWGGWWRRPFDIDGPWDIQYAGCGQWRTVLGFSFLALLGFLASAILGAIVVTRYYKKDKNDCRAGTQTTQISNPVMAPHGGVAPGGHGATGPGAPVATPATQPGQSAAYV